VGHRAEEPGVHFHQDLSLGAKVEWKSCFDVFNATPTQAQVADPAAKQPSVQRKACDLGVTSAGIPRHATTVNA
jgi:hypothetical protein